MSDTRKPRSLSPTPGRKSLKIKPLGASLPQPGGVSLERRTGAKFQRSKKGVPFRKADTRISRAEIAAFKKVMSVYGARARGVKKTMSKAAIEQRRAAGKSSAIKRGFATPPP